jgi:hypothetical protein
MINVHFIIVKTIYEVSVFIFYFQFVYNFRLNLNCILINSIRLIGYVCRENIIWFRDNIDTIMIFHLYTSWIIPPPFCRLSFMVFSIRREIWDSYFCFSIAWLAFSYIFFLDFLPDYWCILKILANNILFKIIYDFNISVLASLTTSFTFFEFLLYLRY